MAKLSLVLAVLAGTCASLEPVLLADGARAAPVEADLGLSMAGGEVGLGLRCGALGADSVTHALVSALRLLPALLIMALVSAFGSTTRTLAGTADFVGL